MDALAALLFAEQLAYLGATTEELHQMLVVNPRRLLRIEEGDQH